MKNLDKFKSLKNKIVLVTGTSRGIGKEIAKTYLQNNCTVIGISSNRKSSNVIKNKKYFHFFCDLENFKEIKSTINQVLKKFKKINIIINNAGITLEEEEKFEKNFINFKKTLNVNLVSAYAITKLIIKKRKISSIVNISSIGGILGFPSNPAYQASKAGLIGLTKSLARDYGTYDINCNAVLPGYFKTKMNKKSYQNSRKRKLRSNLTILGRWGELKELVNIVVFLSSDSAKYITGQSIVVDGGISAKGL